MHRNKKQGGFPSFPRLRPRRDLEASHSELDNPKRPTLLTIPAEIRQYILSFACLSTSTSTGTNISTTTTAEDTTGPLLIHVGIERLPASIFSRGWRTQKRGTLRLYYCSQGNDICEWQHSCWYPLAPSRSPDPQLRLLAPAMTCRGLRGDALAALYASVVFDVKDAHVIPEIETHLPERNLMLIQRLRVLMVLNDFPNRDARVREEYENWWRALRRLKGLRFLLVKIEGPIGVDRVWIEHEETYLGSVRGITGLERFEVIAPTTRRALSPDKNWGIARVRGVDEEVDGKFFKD